MTQLASGCVERANDGYLKQKFHYGFPLDWQFVIDKPDSTHPHTFPHPI